MNVTRFAQATKYGIDVDSGIPKGNMYHIACSAWFTSTGQTMPRYFKFEDDAGEVQTVKDILVKYTEEKNYSGIPSREYGCEAVIGGYIARDCGALSDAIQKAQSAGIPVIKGNVQICIGIIDHSVIGNNRNSRTLCLLYGI